MAREIARAPHVPTPGPYALETRHLVSSPQIPSSAPPRVSILAPGAGALVIAGQPVLIRWQTSCPAGLLLYYVQLSTDGGSTYRCDISPLLDGKECTYLWVPTDDLVTSAARLRVVAINWGEALSEGTFMIQARNREPHVLVQPACHRRSP